MMRDVATDVVRKDQRENMATRFWRSMWNIVLLILCVVCSTQVAAAPRAQGSTHQVFLPIIVTPLPPPVTVSRYLGQAGTDVFERYGCKQAQEMQAGQDGVAVLLFGKPAYNSSTEQYGTKLLNNSNTFTSTVDISRSAELWVEGFWRCKQPNNSRITLAIGTSNSGLTSEISHRHAEAWAALVDDVAEYVKSKKYPERITIAAASNIELNWSPPDIARGWVLTYTITAHQRLYVIGDCSGCPYSERPGWVPDNNWTQEDIWYVNWGAYRSYPIPEVYNEWGVSAAQWQAVARWAVDNNYDPMRFWGALTQWQACTDKSDPCTGKKNLPEQGWKQFWETLNRDPKTAQNLPVLTDIRWNY